MWPASLQLFVWFFSSSLSPFSSQGENRSEVGERALWLILCRLAPHFFSGPTLTISRCCLGLFVCLKKPRDSSAFQLAEWIVYRFKIHSPQTNDYTCLTYADFHWFLKSVCGAAHGLGKSLSSASRAKCSVYTWWMNKWINDRSLKEENSYFTRRRTHTTDSWPTSLPLF